MLSSWIVFNILNYRVIQKYGTDADIDFDSGYNNISEEISYWREETDKEYQARLKDEAREAEQV